METLKGRYKRFLYLFLLVDILLFVVFSFLWIRGKVPEKIFIFQNKKMEFDFSLPIEANIQEEKAEVISNHSEKIKENIVFSFQEPFSLYSQKKGSYDISLKLFGVIPIRRINVDVIEEKELIPSGQTVGIEVNTNGVLVLGTGEVVGKDGRKVEPARNIVCTGDYIKLVNGENVATKEELVSKLENLQEGATYLTLERKGEMIEVVVEGVKTNDGTYKLGIWVRDDTQGIGTMTYITDDGKFGALGHGINDVDTGVLMEVCSGNIYEAGIYKVVKGEKGTPGELSGFIKKNEESKLGTITQNTEHGIKGAYQGELSDSLQKKQIALKQEVKKGKGSILCQIGTEVKEYEVEIEKIYANSTSKSKGMVIRITDEKLLEETNGIVQGMSGSPILQNNKIIGAVTHVFVQDPHRGYGTFIEYMLED